MLRGDDPVARVPASVNPAALPRKKAATLVDVDAAAMSIQPSAFTSASARTFSVRPASIVRRVNVPDALPYTMLSAVPFVLATATSMKPSRLKSAAATPCGRDDTAISPIVDVKPPDPSPRSKTRTLRA